LRPVGCCVLARVEAITVTIFRIPVMASPFDDYAVKAVNRSEGLIKSGLLLVPLTYWLCVGKINITNMATNGKECKNKRHAQEIHLP